jgi:chromosome segregation ATPase
MLRAIGRWLRAFGYLMTGQIDAARRTLDTNPHVVRAGYDVVIEEKTARLHQYKQAVAQLIAQEEQKLAKIRALGDDVEKLETLKAGALAKARQTTESLRATGLSLEQIKADADYQRCLAAYNDFTSTLAEKQARIAELEGDVETYRRSIADHKLQLQALLRELEGLRAEASEAVADVITAKQEKEIADALAGIAQDGSAEELQRLRQARSGLRAEARISREMAGTDTRAQEAEFLEYARTTTATDEFDRLIGLAGETDPAAPQPSPRESQKTGLPE